MPTIRLEHVRPDPPRRNRIHRHPFRSAILREAARKTLDRGLGAGVQGMVPHPGHAGRDGRREDDAAAHGTVFQTLLSDEELSPSIEVEDLIVVLLRHVLLPLESLHPGIRHHDIHPAEMPEGPLEETRDLGGFGNVGLDGDGPRPEGDEVRNHFLRRVAGSAVIHHDAGAPGTELEGDAGAHTAAPARDEGDFTVEEAVRMAVLHYSNHAHVSLLKQDNEKKGGGFFHSKPAVFANLRDVAFSVLYI